MKTNERGTGRSGENGVALIIVLGFLGLMLMMAVAFMTQARVERLVSDSSMEAMRARQIAQTGIAAGIQDYVNAIQGLKSQSEDEHDIFLSGDLPSGVYSYGNEKYGSTNLWKGKVKDWVWDWHREGKGEDSIANMKWIWVGEKPTERSRILGRYAYACFDMSGAVDANLLGRSLGDYDAKEYGAQTNRNNVRKMILGAVRATPEMDTESQERLAQHQENWQGFDTPLALAKLTDGKINDGSDKSGNTRWSGIGINEGEVGKISTDYLSCYSYAALHKGSGESERKEFTTDNLTGSSAFRKIVEASGGNPSDVERALRDYTSAGFVPEGTDYPSVKAVPMFNEIQAELKLIPEGNRSKIRLTLKMEFWHPFEQKNSQGRLYTLKAPSAGMGGGATGSEDLWIQYRAQLEDGHVVSDTLEGVAQTPEITVEAKWNEGKPMSVGEENALVYDFEFPPTVTSRVSKLQFDVMKIRGDGLKLEGGGTVDTLPSRLTLGWSATRPELTPAKPTETGDIEVIDPRLNHLKEMWVDGGDGTMGEVNAAAKRGQANAKSELGYETAKSFYCRNGKMETPAELGYLPVWDGEHSWMTLDIFSDKAIDLMNPMVCEAAVGKGGWKTLRDYDVFYTNGTINPYTKEQAVLNGAFYGIDLRVPDSDGEAKDDDVLGADRTKELTEELLKTETPEGRSFVKDGPAGWARVLRHKGLRLDKNQRVALLHNTWGLFNESDRLFVIVVVAQAISEAPDSDGNRVGEWKEDEDMITGERWAVALCWTDASADVGQKDLTKETDIIMFQYLNE